MLLIHFFLTCTGSTETRTAKRTRRPHVFMLGRVPMRLRIDDSSRPVNVVAGYKNNARRPMNYARDRHIDRLAYVCKVWRVSQYVSLLQKKQEDTGRKSKGNAGRIIIQLWRCKMCSVTLCSSVARSRLSFSMARQHQALMSSPRDTLTSVSRSAHSWQVCSHDTRRVQSLPTCERISENTCTVSLASGYPQAIVSGRANSRPLCRL